MKVFLWFKEIGLTLETLLCKFCALEVGTMVESANSEAEMARQNSKNDPLNDYKHSYQVARIAFLTTLQRADPTNEDEFITLLKFAIEDFGMKAVLLAERLNYGKGAISKWLNSSAVPSLATREVALSWMKDQISAQIKQNEKNFQRPLVPA